MTDNAVVAEGTKTVVVGGGNGDYGRFGRGEYDAQFAAIGHRDIVNVARDEGSQTRRFVLEGQRDIMVQVEKVAAASAVQVEKIAAAAALQAAQNHAAALAQAAECCCELRALVLEQNSATRDLIRAQRAEELAIELSDAKAKILALELSTKAK